MIYKKNQFTVVIFVAAVILLVAVYCCQNLLEDYNCRRHTNTSYATETIDSNLTFIKAEATNRKRIKRFIIFNGTGVVKLVVGTTFPIIMPVKTRSLNQFYNIQLQYVPPPIPLYWWSFYNTSTFAARKQRSADMLLHHDNSRASIYKFMETILKRFGNFGNECLLKVICEVARASFSEDLQGSDRAAQGRYEDEDNGRHIFHKLINAIFTPLYYNVDERYINAREAGLNGANCDKTFGKCYLLDVWLQRYTRSM